MPVLPVETANILPRLDAVQAALESMRETQSWERFPALDREVRELLQPARLDAATLDAATAADLAAAIDRLRGLYARLMPLASDERRLAAEVLHRFKSDLSAVRAYAEIDRDTAHDHYDPDVH